MTERIKKTAAFVKDTLLSEDSIRRTSREQMLYRWEHTLRVASLGQTIARAEGMDEEALVVACLLHDIGYCEYSDDVDWHEHGWMGERIARPFVEGLNFSEQAANDILFGIAAHVTDKGNFEWQESAFTKSVGDCDNIDRYDAFRIYDTLHGMEFRDLPIEEQRAFVDKKVKGLPKGLEMTFATPTATALWKDKIDFQIEFFTRLGRQLNSTID